MLFMLYIFLSAYLTKSILHSLLLLLKLIYFDCSCLLDILKFAVYVCLSVFAIQIYFSRRDCNLRPFFVFNIIKQQLN